MEPASSMDSLHLRRFREISVEIAFAEEIRLPSRRTTNQPWRTKDKQAL